MQFFYTIAGHWRHNNGEFLPPIREVQRQRHLGGCSGWVFLFYIKYNFLIFFWNFCDVSFIKRFQARIKQALFYIICLRNFLKFLSRLNQGLRDVAKLRIVTYLDAQINFKKIDLLCVLLGISDILIFYDRYKLVYKQII